MTLEEFFYHYVCEATDRYPALLEKVVAEGHIGAVLVAALRIAANERGIEWERRVLRPVPAKELVSGKS